MARCGCQGATCSCVVTGGGGVTVTGSGSESNPYVVSSVLNLSVLDTASIDMTLAGDGSSGNPWIISGVANLDLDELVDVDVASATTGQVLAKQADGQWRAVAPTTAPAGTINLSGTGGLQGDGSAGNPLAIKLAPSSGLTLAAAGLSVTGAGAAVAYTPVWGATSSAPTLGNGSIFGFWSQSGKWVDVYAELVIGSTSKRGVGSTKLTLPVEGLAGRRQLLTARLYVPGVAQYTGVGIVNGNGQGIERVLINTSTASQEVSHSVPASMPAGSILHLNGRYEVA